MTACSREASRLAPTPSGHATIGTALALSLLLVSSSRWRPWLAVAGGCVSSIFATGVLFAGWHRPSDALGALAWSGICMNLAAALAIRLKGRPRPAIAHPGRAVFGSVGLGIVVAAASWLTAAATAPEYRKIGRSFGFVFWKEGGWGTSVGKKPSVQEIAAWTSVAASPRFLFREDRKTKAHPFAIVSGLAP